MKKLNIIIALTLFALVGCKDKLEELYVDPSKTTTPSIEKFFTRMLDNGRVRPNYWEIRTFALPHTAKYAQNAAFINGTKMYQQQLSYLQNRWDDYYTSSDNGGGIVAQYREIEKTYAALTDAQKQDAEVFLQAARVIYFDETSEMVDLWGDIPFSEAGSLNLTNEIKYPKFDDSKEIYNTVLTGLKEAADYFATATVSSVTQTTFKKQDILLGGDIEKWKRYTNSLRLRLLMRISFADEPKAKAEITSILADPSTYPLVDDAKYNVLLKPLDNYTDDLHSALGDLSAQFAPSYLLDQVMKPANDPRIPVMFDKYGQTINEVFVPNADYTGLPATLNASEQEENSSKGKYAIFDSATFINNSKIPGIVITAAEVHFLKVEAFERWGLGDAATEYSAGIKESIKFYYYLNSISSFAGRSPLAAPSDLVIDAFIANPQIAYSGTKDEKLAKIWTQKWVDFGFLQSPQSWSEVRRTKYPALTFLEDSSTPSDKLPPSRLLYPETERSQNSKNYQAVAAKDNVTTRIFWDVK
jgi:hypothetical protein